MTTSMPAYPMTRGCPFHPPEPYTRLRAEEPISRIATPDGGTAWLVTRYADVRALLNDPRISSDRAHPNLPTPIPLTPEIRLETARVAGTMLGLDPPEHSAPRRMLIGEFTVKRVRALRPRIQRIVDGLLDRMLAAGPPADLVQALSVPVPFMTVCEELGIPYADTAFFTDATQTLINRESTSDQRRTAMARMYDHLDRVITGKEREPTDDLLGRLVSHNRETGVFDHDGLVGLAQFLLVAGHESTANMISLGTLGLLGNPEQLALLRQDPALVAATVDELLRFFTIIDTLPRVAKADIEVGGQLIRAGEGIVLALGSANRDDAVYPRPDTLDIRRDRRSHVSFAYGVHQCLGQHLARAELEIVFRTLFTRIPDLRVAVPMAELPFKDDASVHGLHRLPVTWGATSG